MKKTKEIDFAGSVKALANAFIKAKQRMKSLSAVIDTEILRSILEGVRFDFSTKENTAKSIETFEVWTKKNEIYNLKIEAQFSEDKERWDLLVSRQNHGNTKKSTIDEKFFIGDDYSFLTNVSDNLKEYSGYEIELQISKDGEKEKAESFSHAVNKLMAEVERKITKQRYKGLGEMNPEQLWDTTMDPEIRVLLRVNIEDAITSDAMFTTLMGEEVEPRRNFIEKNALNALNIDY
jgi:DNA gyrase subunit B